MANYFISSHPVILFIFTWLLAGQPVSGAAVNKPATAAKASILVDVDVDARVELFSLIFRLAGCKEYNECCLPPYQKEMDAWFEPWRNHPAILKARELKKSNKISYEAPMNLAVHLTDIQTLAERFPFAGEPAGLDRRWLDPEIQEFLALVRQFVWDSHFQDFIAHQQDFYRQSAADVRALVERDGALDWLTRFYGPRPGAHFKIVVALQNGGNNYGANVRLGDGEELYCFIGAWRCDGQGQPVIGRDNLWIAAHEFSHSYINPLVFKHETQFARAGRNLLNAVNGRINPAYGAWKAMTLESIVRAATVRYLHETQGPEAAAAKMRSDIRAGFPWTGELAQLLETYEAQRDRYPDLEAFFPEIVAFFDEYSHHRDQTVAMR